MLLLLIVLNSCNKKSKIENTKSKKNMRATEQLKSLLNENYESEDGDKYKIELKQGLTDLQIDEFAKKLPNRKIPNDIIELLKFSSGFNFYGLEEITFDGVGQFGFEEFFPNSVLLAGDGFGNFWILDIHKNGDWGNVFYVCHDPAVVVKHSENISEFIKHVDEFGKNGRTSNLDIIHEKTVMEIWNQNDGFIELEIARKSNDLNLKNFALKLPDNYVIADLRNKQNKSGFAWGKFGPNIDNAIRDNDELVWGIEKPIKKGFLSKIFGKK